MSQCVEAVIIWWRGIPKRVTSNDNLESKFTALHASKTLRTKFQTRARWIGGGTSKNRGKRRGRRGDTKRMNILAIFRAQNRSDSLGSCALLKREKLARLSRGVGTFLSSLPSAAPQTLTTTNNPSKLLYPTNGSHKGGSHIFIFHTTSPLSLSFPLLIVVVSAANRTQIDRRCVLGGQP